jgi:hypothetical protein
MIRTIPDTVEVVPVAVGVGEGLAMFVVVEL